MLLPLSDAPNPRGLPAVTYGLIAANVLVYLLITVPLENRRPDWNAPAARRYLQEMREYLPPGPAGLAAIRRLSAYDLFVFEHGYRPARPELADLFTSMFLHGGFLHLFGNMLFLWIYGDNVEHRLGRLRFLLAYLLTGAAATLFFSLFARGSPVPLVGASGAISGVLGFYFRWFPHNVVRLLVLFFPFFMNVVAVPARLVLGVYLLLDNLLPFLLTGGGSGSGVAYGAHIGGFLAGLVLAGWWDRREERAGPHEFRQRAPLDAAPPPLTVRGALRSGDFETAARLYFSLPPEETAGELSPWEALRLAQWLEAEGHVRPALTVYRRILRDHPAGPGRAEAHVGAGRILLRHLRQPASAYQHFLDALDNDPPPEVEAEARAGLEEIAALQKLALRRFRG
ncbi:MAG: rhomboid family intramembrane serine protease [Verrucomicrobia bacterium]|nr:MAG: rhomboid family intramembrane serine protease [Verrucomicrobiota bacterium]